MCPSYAHGVDRFWQSRLITLHIPYAPDKYASNRSLSRNDDAHRFDETPGETNEDQPLQMQILPINGFQTSRFFRLIALH